MRLRTASLAATVLAAALTLTACNDTSDKGTGPVTTDAPTQSSESPAPGGSSQGTGETGGSGKDKGSTTGGGGIAAAAKCKTSALGFQVDPGGEAADASAQGKVTITLTNKGTAPCSLKGYPGIDLMSAPGDTWSLTRQTSAKPKALTLDPGGDVYFTITYLPYSAEGNTKDAEFKAATITLTPPGETESKDLPWPHKTPLLKQDAATHPGTFVGPVTDEPANV
jgi:predicted small secreted protein